MHRLNLPSENLADYLYMDVQTSGFSPNYDSIIEIGWKVAGKKEVFLISDQAIEIPSRISKITGIKPEELKQGEKLDEVRQHWKNAVAKAKAIVIHYAQFEKAFLKDWFQATSTPIICTQKWAKISFPDLKTYTMKSLAHFLCGRNEISLKRCQDHLSVTEAIFQELFNRHFQIDSPTTYHGSQQNRLELQMEHVRGQRLASPNRPGVYFFLTDAGLPLYIGKATQIKMRLSSHFNGKRNKKSKKNELLLRCTNLNYVTTSTLLEAELLESDLIKHFSPPYNSALQLNDKKVLYYGRDLSRTEKHDPENQSQSVIGPFVNTNSLETFDTLYRIIKGLRVPADGIQAATAFLTEALCIYELHELRNTAKEIFGVSNIKFLKNKRSFMAQCLQYFRMMRQKAIEMQLVAHENHEERKNMEKPIAEEKKRLLKDDVGLDSAIEISLKDILESNFCRIGKLFNQTTRLQSIANLKIYIPKTETDKENEILFLPNLIKPKSPILNQWRLSQRLGGHTNKNFAFRELVIEQGALVESNGIETLPRVTKQTQAEHQVFFQLQPKKLAWNSRIQSVEVIDRLKIIRSFLVKQNAIDLKY